jgi:hypothetical protein
MKKYNKKSVPKSRAIELYARDTPFKPKIVRNKKIYSRKDNNNTKNIDI